MASSRKPGSDKKAKTASVSAAAGASFQTAFESIPDFFRNTRLPAALIFVLAFGLYVNTLSHGFVLDDGIVITDNMFTKQGIKGIPGLLSKDTFFGFFKVEGKDQLVSGGRYRPLTPVLFAVVYQIAGDKPFLFHLLTVTLFALTCVVLYYTLRLVFHTRGASYAGLLAFVTAVLFAAHPIHTEVVANVKGCDEIVTLLFSLGALYAVFKAWDTQKNGWGIGAAVLFLLACLSKENAVTFLGVIPLALWFFRTEPGKNNQISAIMGKTLPVFAAFIVFFAIRSTVLGWKFGGAPMELMNNPYLKIVGERWVSYTFPEKLAAICATLTKYVSLLVFPHPLTHDYYPRVINAMSFSNPMSLIGLLGYVAMGIYAIRGIARRDNVRFGILYYLLTLSIVSNLVFPIGTHMGERFAFMPSVGFCLIVATGLLYLSQQGRQLNVSLGLTALLVLLYAGKTLTRNPVWESNERLFLTDVAVSGNSAKIRNACGGALFDKAGREKDEALKNRYYQESIVHLTKGLELYPNYSDAYITRAGAYYYTKQYEASISDYRQAVRLAPEKQEVKTFLAVALRDGGKYQGEQKNDLPTALRYLQESWTLYDKDAETARLLGVANGVGGNNAEAIRWFTEALKLAPDNPAILFDLGTSYLNAGDRTKGAEYRQRALDINPKFMEERAQSK